MFTPDRRHRSATASPLFHRRPSLSLTLSLPRAFSSRDDRWPDKNGAGLLIVNTCLVGVANVGDPLSPHDFTSLRVIGESSLSLSLFDPLSPSSRDLSSVSFRLNGPGNFREGEKSFEKRKEREGERIDKEAKGRKEEAIVLFEQRYLESIIYNFSRRPSFDLDERCRWGEQDN